MCNEMDDYEIQVQAVSELTKEAQALAKKIMETYSIGTWQQIFKQGKPMKYAFHKNTVYSLDDNGFLKSHGTIKSLLHDTLQKPVDAIAKAVVDKYSQYTNNFNPFE